MLDAILALIPTFAALGFIGCGVCVALEWVRLDYERELRRNRHI